MRRRLTVTMVLMVLGALVLSGVVSLLVAVHDTENQTRHELVREANGLAVTVQVDAAARAHPATALRTLLRELTGPLRLEGSAVVGIREDGALFDPAAPSRKVTLPKGVTHADLNTAALLAGDAVSGVRGGLVFAAAPYTAAIPIGTTSVDVVQAVVLTRRPPSALAEAGGWFAASSLAILAVALLLAYRMGRRFVQPILAAESVTREIAAGDLDARVRVPRGDPELASLAGSINSMAESLARAQGAERQFFQSVSHDLRTPLTSIRGFAEALEDGTAADVPRAAAVIGSEARRLERLVADLLSLATLEGRRFTLQPREIDLAESARTTVAGFLPAAADLGVSVLVDEPPGPVGVTADPDRLAQVTANLVENALRFAGREVRVAAVNGRERPELWVSDDGPGISGADLPHVFDRFFTSGHRADRAVGSGLGLAIVAELVGAMGGTVRAESPITASGGTRMVVTLPPDGDDAATRDR